MDIRTISISRPAGQEAQTDYRGGNLPNGVVIALADGRIIMIGDKIVVHGPDMETLLEADLPDPDVDLMAAFAGIPGGTVAPIGGIEQYQAEGR